MASRLNLYSIFHLNILYSAIPQKEWPVLVKQCYWPLLRLCEEGGAPVSITAPAYTLEQINRIDSGWIVKFKELWREKKCEFLGSGYAQIIGPLVPALVNEKNLQIGSSVYQSLLGQKPSIAYVNEQTYSAGLVDHYLEAGYEAIVMEWNNPRKAHPEWKEEWQYALQLAQNQQGRSIPVIWNNSIAFQKLQRYAHGELELEEYRDYLASHAGSRARFFPLYGNDVEIFDYRPGRYHTEAKIHKQGEWKRIKALFEHLRADSSFQLVLPSTCLTSRRQPQELHVESPQQPLPVKKQEKYTVARWGLTGRDDIGINTACYQIYEKLKKKKAALEDWKELCFLWSSDFRTHIEKEKWHSFQKRLQKMLHAYS